MSLTVIRTERGWGGHFIGVANCRFRRNTLLDRGDCRIVVSTVGNYCQQSDEQMDTCPVPIRHNCYYETMAFHADTQNEADVADQIPIDSDCKIIHPNADVLADAMHETVVAEVTEKLLQGHYRDPSIFIREIDQRREAYLRKSQRDHAEEAWDEAVRWCLGIAINIVREVYRDEGPMTVEQMTSAIMLRIHEEFD